MGHEEERSFGFCVSFISRQAHRYFDQQFRLYEMNRGSLYILRRLYLKDGVHLNTLGDSLHMDKANITRAIAKLLETGYIRKEQDIADSRAYLVYLTPKAWEFKARFDAIFMSWDEVITAGFSEDDKNILKLFLQKMCDNAHACLEKGITNAE
ncbi:MAG TPA: MarR family transcriptional regulator [Candidatus Cloacimonadota bacterium]|nr:MarR family transcriptional regulator [Candidatus Cloacimonadota bacterium]